MKNEYGNDSFISKATNVDLSQEEMESAKACLRLTLKVCLATDWYFTIHLL